MYKCEICEKEIKTKKGMIMHLQRCHNKLQTFDEKYKYFHYTLEGLDVPKCKYCNNEIYVNSVRGSHVCNNSLCKSKYFSDIQKEIHKKNPQLAINARKRRIKYLSNKNNFNSTAFGKRANKELSFLEKWFYDNIILKYNLTDKYLIINEYSIINEDNTSAYSLDFAFVNIKLDIELDGRCHFNHGEERQESDYKRDNFLIKNGWNVYRISFWDIEHNPEETINKFITLLNENKFEYDKTYYLRNKVITNKEFQKQYNKHKDKEYIKEQNNKKILEYKELQKNILQDLEKNSGIDFTKFGWVKLANDYLMNKNIVITQLHRHFKKYYPEFFDNNKVFIRK